MEIEELDGELWFDVDPDAKCLDDTVSGAYLDAEAVDKLIEVLREWRSRNP